MRYSEHPDSFGQPSLITQIITSNYWPGRVYWSIGPLTTHTASLDLMTTHIGSTAPRRPWYFRERSSVQLATPVSIPRCCLHRLPWGLNIRVQLIPTHYYRLMLQVSSRMANIENNEESDNNQRWTRARRNPPRQR